MGGSCCCLLTLKHAPSFLLPADTTASGYKNVYATTSTTDTHVKGTGKGHKVAEVHTTTDTATHHPITKTIFNSPPPSPKPPPPPRPNPPPPPNSPPPPGAYVGNGGVPVSYFSDAVMPTSANGPYTLQFSQAKVYNGGTNYFIGNMLTPTEQNNVFTVPVTGGANCGTTPRRGTLYVTCSATTTSFTVNENPTCVYAMYYSTTQACPPGTVLLSPPPPAPMRPAVLSLARCPSFTQNSVTYSLCYPGAVTQSYPGGFLGIGSYNYNIGTPTWNPNGYYDLTGGSGCGSVGARSGRMYVLCNPLQSQSYATAQEPQTCKYNITWVTPQACTGLTGVFINSAGNCLDAAGGGTSSGTAVQSWQCGGAGAQIWIQQSQYGTYLNPQSGLCLDVSTGSATGNMQLYPCNGTPSQKFNSPASFNGPVVSAIGTNNCLDSAGGANGARAKLAPCNGGASQQWLFRTIST